MQPNVDDIQVKRINICIAKLDFSWNTIPPHVVFTHVRCQINHRSPGARIKNHPPILFEPLADSGLRGAKPGGEGFYNARHHERRSPRRGDVERHACPPRPRRTPRPSRGHAWGRPVGLYLRFPHDVGGGARPGRRGLPLPLLQPAAGRGEDAVVGGTGGTAQRRGRGGARQERQLPPGAPLPAGALLVEEGAARRRPLQRGAGGGERSAGGRRRGSPRSAAFPRGAAGGPRPRRPARAFAFLTAAAAAADDGGVEAARLAEPPLGEVLGGGDGGGGGGRGGAGEDAAQQALRRHRGGRCPPPPPGSVPALGASCVPSRPLTHRARVQPPAARLDGGTGGLMAASGAAAATAAVTLLGG